MKEEVTSGGITMGCALAIVISYTKWHSVLWAVLHGVCGWLYVIYFLFTR